jgi:hypothetical protein
MRLLTLKTPVLALILAFVVVVMLLVVSLAVNFALSPETEVNALDRALEFFHMPAYAVAFLCLPSSWFDKGHEPMVLPRVVLCLVPVLQWYAIFLGGIGCYRHFRGKPSG